MPATEDPLCSLARTVLRGGLQHSPSPLWDQAKVTLLGTVLCIPPPPTRSHPAPTTAPPLVFPGNSNNLHSNPPIRVASEKPTQASPVLVADSKEARGQVAEVLSVSQITGVGKRSACVNRLQKHLARCCQVAQAQL